MLECGEMGARERRPVVRPVRGERISASQDIYYTIELTYLTD